MTLARAPCAGAGIHFRQILPRRSRKATTQHGGAVRATHGPSWRWMSNAICFLYLQEAQVPTTTEDCAREMTSGPTPSWLCAEKLASSYGDSNSFIMTSGISTAHRLRY